MPWLVDYDIRLKHLHYLLLHLLHNPAFHGVASKKITDSDRENQQEVLNAIAAEALAGFPLAGGTIGQTE